jgi:hypothetical protein
MEHLNMEDLNIDLSFLEDDATGVEKIWKTWILISLSLKMMLQT